MRRKIDPFKGLHRCRRRNADGHVVIYCYAWRGGPLLKDAAGFPIKEGTAEFARAFLAAKTGYEDVSAAAPKTVADLIREYRAASEFTRLGANSQRNYRGSIKKIELEFGTMPLLALRSTSVRHEFKRWRDSFCATPRQADYHMMVLTRIFSVAKDNGYLRDNPCAGIGDIYDPDRTEALWSEADLAKLFAVASPEIRTVVMFALWTGQRQGRILTMPWSAYDGHVLAFPNNKRKRGQKATALRVPVAAELRQVIDALPKASPVMLVSSRKTPWTSSGFQTSFGKTCAAAKITGLTFHDLRGTAVTRLALAGCSVPEIASITGHTLDDVAKMLDRHYLGDRAKLAESAIVKLETRTNAVKNSVKSL